MRIFVMDKWKIIRYVCALLVISFVISLAGRISTDIIATVAGTAKKLPIYCVDTVSNDVSLTFDCAWGESR